MPLAKTSDRAPSRSPRIASASAATGAVARP